MELYSTSQDRLDWNFSPSSTWQLSLTDSDKDNLDYEVTDDEIKAALWSLKASKAPGPNGLHRASFNDSG